MLVLQSVPSLKPTITFAINSIEQTEIDVRNTDVNALFASEVVSRNLAGRLD